MERSMRGRALKLVLLARFVRSRWGYRFRSRAAFEAWQARRLRRFLRRLDRVPFYRGRPHRTLASLPITDKATMLENFDTLNTRGVRLVEALEVGLAAERSRDFSPLVAGDLTVGLSSGTSGQRAAFLVSPRERMLWAGTVLARLLDRDRVAQLLRPWRPPVRIAFFLRAGGGLYESVASSRVRFAFYDLTRPLDEHIRALNAGGPVDLLVAPASVLDALAEAALPGGPTRGSTGGSTGGSTRGSTKALSIRPAQVISVAEVLEPRTAEAVRRAWGVAPRQVYQATEGLLALGCDSGALHLAEESVLFEREWLDAERTRFIPLVTDLGRRTQIIARHRLDDVLRFEPLAPERCACGRVTAVLAAVDGRADAVLHFPSLDGRTTVAVFPDALRQAVLSAGAPAPARATAVAERSALFTDWRLRQTGTVLRVALRDPAAGAEQAVLASLEALLARYGCSAQLLPEPFTPPPPATKVRRITREPTP